MSDTIVDDLTRAREAFLSALDDESNDAIARMAEVYRDLRRRLVADLESDIAKIAAGGLSASGIERTARTRSLLDQVEDELTRFADFVRVEAGKLQTTGIDAGSESFIGQMRMLLGEGVRVGVGWDVLPRDAIRQTVSALSEDSPLFALLNKFGTEGREQWRRELVRGIAIGDNPRVVASRLAAVTDGGMIRAARIARTEMMRGYREAHHENYKNNAGVIKGWMWMATFQPRTCPACLSKHGQIFPLTQKLVDHPNGRCTPAPVTKTWAELGFPDLVETSLSAQPVQSGEDWLRQQPPSTQVSVLGARGQREWAAGRVALADFVGVNRSRVWGDSIKTASVSAAISSARRRGGGQTPPPAGPQAAPKPPAPPRTPRPAPERSQRAPRAAATADRQALLERFTFGSRPGKTVTRVIEMISRLHTLDTLPKIPITETRKNLIPGASGIRGVYSRNILDRPVAIKIKIGSGQMDLTTAHEFGHFVDNVLGRPFASQGDKASRVMDAIRASEAYNANKALVDQRTVEHKGVIVQVSQGHLAYVLYEPELFARAYAQWVAVRSGDAKMIEQIKRDQDAVYRYQWGDSEFEPIAQAFDDMFRESGWTTKK